jgi:hypothetical protein
VKAVATPAARTTGLTQAQWVICVIAAIGFAFDTYELLMLPLIVRPALTELIAARPDSAEFNTWVGSCSTCPPSPAASSGCSAGT